ncbi:hypothetical protein BD779DRAFT_1680439 [Infundibulicybe gibba]|nr:hypothetical protein BD779DRAFT_1680439 [Infundibulicybe gibba]
MAASSLLLPLSKADYPKVRYWSTRSFKPAPDATVFCEVGGKSQHGKGQQAQGKNLMYPFIEDRNGLTVTGAVVDRIMALARRVFAQLLESNAAPPTWGQGTPHAQSYF